MAINMSHLLRDMGTPGRFQMLVFAMLLTTEVPMAFNNLSMLFYGYGAIPHCVDVTTGNQSVMSAVNISSLSVGRNNVTVQLERADDEGKAYYHLEPGEWTIVAEWNLTCERAYMGKLSTTIYFLGEMVGGLAAGFFSDRYGRRSILLVCVFVKVLVGIGIALSTNFLMFTIMRFFLGILLQGLLCTSYAMKMEMSIPRYRNIVAAAKEMTFGLSVLLLGVIASYAGRWRYIQWIITANAVFCACYIWFVPESLRWLMLNGRYPEAEKHVKRICWKNGLSFPIETFESVKRDVTEHIQEEQTKGKYTIMDLVRTPIMRKRSIASFYIWFATSLLYYGLVLGVTDLPGDKYTNFFVGVAFELAASPLGFYILPKFGRRKPLLASFGIVALCCIVAGSIPDTSADGRDLRMIQTGLSLFGRSATVVLYTVIMLYGSELFPTVIRTLGLGASSFFLRLGCVLAPQMLILGLYTHRSVPVAAFGIIALTGLASTFLLPETNNKKLPETIEDVEKEQEETVFHLDMYF